MGTILIVDDTLFMRTLLKNILFSGGHTIAGEAANGEEAVAKYKELKPDLVTMDVVMPKVNGIEALKAIKQLDPAARVDHVHRRRAGTDGQARHKDRGQRVYRQAVSGTQGSRRSQKRACVLTAMAKVLIVDDSVFMRTVIRDMLQKDPSLEIVGTASNGIEALEKIRTLRPDLITLDIEMPRMNGLEVLRELKNAAWRPKTLMLSSLTSEGAEMTAEAIRLGADDFMLKPKDVPQLRLIADELVATIRHLLTSPPSPRKEPSVVTQRDRNAECVVLIGSSAGGPPMLDVILSKLPADLQGRCGDYPAYARRIYCTACCPVQPSRPHAGERDGKRGYA